MNKGTKVAEIFSTSDYGMFKRLPGNRTDIKRRAKRVEKSIKQYGYISSPICVNEKMEVVDGQARLEALKNLGMPIEYFVARGVGKKECIALNVFQTNWSINDYIESYAEDGNEAYGYLYALGQEFATIPFTTRLYAATGNVGHAEDKRIKEGRLIVTEADYDHAVEMLTYLAKFKPIITRIKGNANSYYFALGFCFDHPYIDNDRLYRNVELRQAGMIPVTNTEQALNEIEKVYNYRSRQTIFITTEYKIAMSKKVASYSARWWKNR